MSADRLAAMEIFVRVVDAGSLSAAANQLGVGQPAVSKAVAQLERRLGVRLLMRSTRRLNLTDAGGVIQAIKTGKLVVVLDEWCPRIPGLALYYPGHRQVPAGLRAFIEVLKETERGKA